MSFILSGLESLETFFSDELTALENFTNFLASDVVSFFQTVSTDLQNFISFLATAISDIPTFIQQGISYFVQVLQNVFSNVASAVSGFVQYVANALQGFFQDVANLMQGFLNAIYGFFSNIANDLANFVSGAVSNFVQGFGAVGTYIGSAIPQIINQVTPIVAPYLLARILPNAIDRLAEILPGIEIDLAPVGLGGKFNIKFGEIAKMIGEPTADLMKEITDEMMSSFKEFLKEPFISDFKITTRQIFNSIGLGDLPFADPSYREITSWVGARSFQELKDHLRETLLLTGYPAWFTDAFLEPPADDYIPRNPLFRPVSIRDVIIATEYGLLPSSAVEQYAENNLITKKTAKLMYQNQNLRLFQRVVEQGVRSFVVQPDKAYDLMLSSISLSGKDLFTKYFEIEYQFATQRFAKQVLRSLLSRALSNFGRPYIDIKYLSKTVDEIYKQLNLPKEISLLFEQLITESQLIQYNELIFRFLQSKAEKGIFDQKDEEKLLKDYNFNVSESLFILQNYVDLLITTEEIQLIQQKLQNFFISDKDAEKELKKLKVDNRYAKLLIERYYNLTLMKEKANVYLSLLKKGYYNKHEAKTIFKALGYTTTVIDELLDLYSQEIATELQIKVIQQKAQMLLLDAQEIETELKKLHVSDALIHGIITEYLQIPLLKQQIAIYESMIKKGYVNAQEAKKIFSALGFKQTAIEHLIPLYMKEIEIEAIISKYKALLQHFLIDEKTAEQELRKLNISDALIAELLAEYYQVPLAEKVFNIYLSLLEKGYTTVDTIKKILGSKNVNATALAEISNAYNFAIEIENSIKYIQSLLKNLLIDDKTAEQELRKLGVSDTLIKAIIAEYTPILINIKSVAQTIIEGAIYHISKVPISVAHVIPELKKLNIPDNQINALINEIESQVALEIWRKYLPTLSDIKTALTYNYPVDKLLQLSLIPAELFNLHADLTRYEIVAKEVQNLKSYYSKLLTYNITNPQLEQILRQYGVSDQLLQVLQLHAQLEKILTAYQELYLTPSKVLSIAEYVSNPDQLIQKVFREYNVPADLQSIYLEYARNRRLRKYISEIISTISLLFEKHKISLDQAVQYLLQFKKYGLTDEEIELIKLNWQLRSAY
ncbi:putative minor structural protein [Saccharolobus solfataricus rod-shaped virus 1]|uniref:Putative minor structural protein n=1 Tax=Saccharolobus solfataricus rod-shaped virus 1 TaxID=2730619 RepID=A0A6M3VYW7_SSRV1|nr:putative minor structural protein [Saccharolobus solfataricus rod-shaped virus 1]QJF12299.1 putative minor structural protein [Saccharolobus solfataricus rod-shaped virus 1]